MKCNIIIVFDYCSDDSVRLVSFLLQYLCIQSQLISYGNTDKPSCVSDYLTQPYCCFTVQNKVYCVHTACAQFSVYPAQFSESAARKYCASVTFRRLLEAVISRQPDQMYYFFEKKYFTALLGRERTGAHEGSIENPPTVRASHQVYG